MDVTDIQNALSEAIEHGDDYVAGLCRDALAGDEDALHNLQTVLSERDQIRHEILRYEMGSDY